MGPQAISLATSGMSSPSANWPAARLSTGGADTPTADFHLYTVLLAGSDSANVTGFRIERQRAVSEPDQRIGGVQQRDGVADGADHGRRPARQGDSRRGDRHDQETHGIGLDLGFRLAFRHRRDQPAVVRLDVVGGLGAAGASATDGLPGLDVAAQRPQ